uniref:PiggyBac transposable element-derived protein 3 n=1 Tax=Sipha flava TaxID=143950 RepID=A0A2S2PY46_9HEMI
MSYNRFTEIKRYIHFADNSNQHNTVIDKYWKVRPVLDILHQSFYAATSTNEHIAIDEMMVSFKEKSYLKQYLKSKPKKWGFKIWVQASTRGYVYCFKMYQGASNLKRTEFGAIGDTVVKLCHEIHGKNHKLFVDNLFTSVPLLRKLRSFNIYMP